MVQTASRPQSVFRSSEFCRYYAGQALSYLGDGLRTLVNPLLVFHLTGSAVSLGLTFAFELLPFALFSLLGGSLADRLDRRKLMLGADAVRCLIMTGFTVALWRGVLTLPLLYAGVVLLLGSARRSSSAPRPPAFRFCWARIAPRPPSPPWSRPNRA
jgi:MFS family permease